MTRKLMYICLGVLVGGCVIFGLFLGLTINGDGLKAKTAIIQVFANQGSQELNPNISVLEENVYICGNVEEVSRTPLRTLNIKTEKELKEKYPSPEFAITIKQEEIVVQRRVLEFCSYHKNFRHLGIHQGKLAIFQGPLGYDQKLLRVEDNIPIVSLSATFQVKLQQAMDFLHMTPETQAKLRYELEFSNEDRLNAMLENLDELQD